MPLGSTRHNFRTFLILQRWEKHGTLYPKVWEDGEALLLRLELEEAGIPMGYGRVTRFPTQLSDEELVHGPHR
jgi:hypothetical protein